jgi:hypothetical protein
VFCVVGNKIDLDNEEVPFDEAQQFAKVIFPVKFSPVGSWCYNEAY